ncbi:MAG: hypothetical protein JNL35_04610 [Sphingopyxis sp.]|nr:hypothetical protein [Sphingopyxis sp.]
MRRPAKFALVALILVVTPFCWSMARDLFPLLLADKDEAGIAEAGIALQVVAEHRRLHIGEAPLSLSISRPAPCYSVPKASVRTEFRLPNKTIDGIDEDFRSSSDMVTMNGYLIPYALFAERIELEGLQTNLSPFELAALNACMTATPFARWCDTHIEENMGADHKQVEQRLVIYGFMRHAIDEYGSEILCTTIPSIEDRPQRGSGQTRP